QINQENVNSLRTFKTGRLDLVERNNVITLDYRRKPVDNRATQSLANASITIAADKPVVVADGTSTTIALGILADEFGNPIVNQEINVEITLEGVTTTTRVTTDSEGKYAVPVPSSSTAGAIANITATTVNLPTNISASTSVLYNGDITTKQLTFNSVKDLLVANIMNYSDLIVTVTDTSGRPIINEEVTIVNKESGETYTGITDATGKFVYEYAPYDPNDKTRFVPGTNIVFEANFVNDPQELKIDQLTLSYGRIEANVNEQTSSLAINVPAEHKFTLKPLMNAIDLTSAQPSVVVDLETKFGLVEEIDYEIEVTPTREIGLSGSYMAVEFDVYITLLDTANTRAKLSEITFNDYYRIDVVRLDIPQIDPKLYALNKITKEYFFIF
ncbi:invasin domain 3-containing protein, partial [Thorsellia anophelis]